jgi:hypothetical protein
MHAVIHGGDCRFDRSTPSRSSAKRAVARLLVFTQPRSPGIYAGSTISSPT